MPTLLQCYIALLSALDTVDIRGVVGHQLSLPCDLTPPHQNETVYLVLWYREDQGEPLYR